MSRSWNHGTRESRHARGYGAAWVKLRKRILERDRYLCQPCRNGTPSRVTAATEVDHITPKANGGTDDEGNLRAICTDCHRAKSASDRGATLKLKRTIAADGWPVE